MHVRPPGANGLFYVRIELEHIVIPALDDKRGQLGSCS